MEKTVPHPYLGRQFIGYVVNSDFSEASQDRIAELQQKFRDQFGNALIISSPETLHITLMDWLAPLVDYGRDKDKIFKEIFEEYDRVVEKSVEDIGPIDVRFGTIGVGSEAIFLTGKDEGQYQTIRERFLGQVSLLPNTKMPPKIIHTTIARFSTVMDLQPVRDFATTQLISFDETINNFRLLRSADTTMDAKKIIKRYYLK